MIMGNEANQHVGDSSELRYYNNRASGTRKRRLSLDADKTSPAYILATTTQQVSTSEEYGNLKEYEKNLELLKQGNKGSGSRKYTLLMVILILLVLGTVVVVIVYLLTSGTNATEATAYSVRKICKTENTEECLAGLEQQLKNDTTAALRSPAHYLFTFGAFSVTILVFSYSLNRKHAARQRWLSSLPNEEIDMWSERRPFNSDIYQAMQTYLYKAVILKKAQLLVVEKRVAENQAERQDCDWGYVDIVDTAPHKQRREKVNFKLNTAASFEYISEIASIYDPELEIAPWETVREYMTRLKKMCAPLEVPIDEARCDEFVQFYEDAKFSHLPFTADKWDAVRQNVDYFHKYFTRLSSSESQQM